MCDIDLPSSDIYSLINPLPRSFSVSLIKKDPSLDENFISIEVFFRSENQVEIEPAEKTFNLLRQTSFYMTCLDAFLAATRCSLVQKP